MDTTQVATVTARIPVALLERTGDRKIVSASGNTVGEVIDTLERDHPGVRFNVYRETGELRPYVNVFLGPENVRYLDRLEWPVRDGDTVHIFHSVAGG